MLVAAACCSGFDDRLLNVACVVVVAVVVVVKITLTHIRAWYQRKGFYADAHRSPTESIYQDNMVLHSYKVKERHSVD